MDYFRDWWLAKLIYLVSYTALLVAAARNPTPQLISSCAVALLGLAVSLFFSKNEKDEDRDKREGPDHHDKVLFNKFRKLLYRSGTSGSPGGAMDFYEEEDLGGSFETDALQKGDEFALGWGDAAHSFNDEELQELKENLRLAIKELHDQIRRYTFADGGNYRKLPQEHERYWESRDVDHSYVRNTLNELASSVFQKHQNLISRGQKKLSD